MHQLLSKSKSFALAVLALPALSSAQSLSFERVAVGLSNPIFVTHAPGDADRLFIAQRSGTIRILDLNTGSLSNFMTVPDVGTAFEGGLLGLAFHPDYQQNGHFFVNYTEWTGGNSTVVARFTRTTATSANPASRLYVMEFSQPQQNHNGGWIGFGPNDGLLYIASGDGGAGNDAGPGHTASTGNAQDITNNLLGKMLRVDVDGDDFPSDPNRNYAIPASNTFVGVTGDDEIFLYGLRNPFRCNFDRQTGDLYIGDVGQGAREEISMYPGSGTTLRNLGWRLREGAIQTPGFGGIGGPVPADGLQPIYDYLRTGLFGGTSVTGGMVYRGPLSCLNGTYFFADFLSNNFWSFHFDGSAPSLFDGTNHTPVVRWNNLLTTDVGTMSNVVCFGEDLAGNMYVADFNGEVFKLVDGTIGGGAFAPACHTQFGSGCAGPFALSSQTVPVDDAVVTFDITDAPEFATGTGVHLGVMIISFTQTLPALDLSIIGAPSGCNAYVGALDVVLAYSGIGSNSASVLLDLPAGVPPGTMLYEQAAAVVDADAANPAGLLTSNAVMTLINTF